MNSKVKIFEGLRSGDLKNYVSETFIIDRYKSKMGEDNDVIVLSFSVKEKHPAMDLVEFIEKGYDFILDADTSAGEEHDGKYQVFVEIERTPRLVEQLKELFGGLSQLCDCREWKFQYQKSNLAMPFSEDSIVENVPLTPEDYSKKMLEVKETDVKQFFDQGAVDLSLSENNIIKFEKPFSGAIEAKFISIGPYEKVKATVPGKISLDENSQSQVLFLNKFLGNYDINKIDNKFLIRNGNNAVVIEKEKW